MSSIIRTLSSALALLAVPAVAAPVINEIMCRPGSGYPEATALEFLEIHNPDSAAVDLSGWAVTTGADFTFPAGTTLPAGGFLVVAADPTALRAATGLTSVLGPWKTGATLANKGEAVTLAKPGATAGTWTTVDRITYADEGDWATRTRDSLGGWSWVCAGSGGGASFERRSPLLAVDSGQNWGPSSAAGGTPGAVNSLYTGNVAPIIAGVSHAPAVPTSSDTVTISCQLADESAASALTATLYWRNATSTTPGTFQTVPMTGDGKGRFMASLDPLSNKQIVEFYVAASDGTLARTWPAPSSEGQNTNCTYQVDNEVAAGPAPVYRLILTAAENSAFTTYTGSSGGMGGGGMGGGSGGDRMFNLTLVASRGQETTIRYLTSMRIRGNSSRSYTYKPLRLSIPTDNRWDGISDFNLNPKASWLQFFAMRLQQAAGLAAADTTPVELRRQGIESSIGSGSVGDYGKWVRVEDFNGDYIDNHFPTAVSGQVYRKTSISAWASTQAAPTNPDSTWSGWSKQNNSGANDWSDVMGFCSAWQAACAAHFPGATAGNVGTGTWNKTGFTDAEMATLATKTDLAYLARWFAFMTIVLNNEPNLSTGEDDDYAAAFINDGAATRMYLLPHDMDTILGTGDQSIAATAVGLFDATETDTVQRAGAGSVTLMKPLLPLLGNSTSAGNPAFRAQYYAAIRELYGTVLDSDTNGNANPAFYQLVDNYLGDWAPASLRTQIKAFMTARQTYLLGLIGAAKSTPAAATSSATATAAVTPTVRLNEVLATNSTTLANGSTYPDAIELLNAGDSAVDLAGKCLTDDPTKPSKYTFPAGTTLAAGAYLVVFADADTSAPGLHTGFALDAEGDRVQFRDTIANGGTLLDEIQFGFQIPDRSLARTTSAAQTWALCAPSLGTANGEGLALGSLGGIKINEWAGNIDYRTDKDFIELYNPSTLPVPLAGAHVTDDLIGRPGRYTFKQLGFIAPGALLVLDTDKLEFGLDGNFDHLFLVGENSTVVDRVSFVSQPADSSSGRTTDGAATWTSFALPTPGLPNNTALPSAYQALLDGLRITEMMFQPTAASSAGDYEFVEFKNIGSAVLELGGVRVTNGIDYTFPTGTTLSAGSYLAVCKNRTAFLSRYPSIAGQLAPNNFSGALDNSGETLALTLPAPWTIHVLRFRYEPSWYPPAAGGGCSLVVRDPSGTAPRDWAAGAKWAASSVNGSPGSDGSGTYAAGIVAQPSARTVIAGSTATLSVLASGTDPLDYQWYTGPSGTTTSPVAGATSSAFTTPPLVASTSYWVRVSNAAGTADSQAVTVTVITPPIIDLNPASRSGPLGGSASITARATGTGTLTWQWYKGGRMIAGATSATLDFSALAPADAGIYDAVASGTEDRLSLPAVLGLTLPAGTKTAGTVATRAEWQDIHHPNGAVYDQYLLTGAAGAFSADPGQIARCSYLDEDDSIVQVEMSGAGAITIVLDNASGPLAPALYNQSGIDYVKGKATIILAGADETTHFTIYSVGTFTNPGVTRADATYAGWANVAVAGIVSTNGALGGIHQGNVSYNAALGFTGIFAPVVNTVGGLVVVHDIEASGPAQPYLFFGTGGTAAVKVAGSSLAQPNDEVINVSGLSQVTMGAGQNSCGVAAPPQSIQTRLFDAAGVDITAALVVGP